MQCTWLDMEGVDGIRGQRRMRTREVRIRAKGGRDEAYDWARRKK